MKHTAVTLARLEENRLTYFDRGPEYCFHVWMSLIPLSQKYRVGRKDCCFRHIPSPSWLSAMLRMFPQTRGRSHETSALVVASWRLTCHKIEIVRQHQRLLEHIKALYRMWRMYLDCWRTFDSNLDPFSDQTHVYKYQISHLSWNPHQVYSNALLSISIPNRA